jgi:hypothetical protein
MLLAADAASRRYPDVSRLVDDSNKLSALKMRQRLSLRIKYTWIYLSLTVGILTHLQCVISFV